jgi:hypothetical protein
MECSQVWSIQSKLWPSSCGKCGRLVAKIPFLISQPRAQWPNLEPSATSGFRGYQPGTSHMDAGSIMGNEEFGTRIMAAGVTEDHLEVVWQAAEEG